jgi:hypothetical protein
VLPQGSKYLEAATSSAVRGWMRGFNAEIHLKVTLIGIDNTLSKNTACFTLHHFLPNFFFK